jgi:hypothetical protein
VSDHQFTEGLEVIRRAIITGVAEVGGDVGISNFRWNHGQAFRPGHPSSTVLLEIVINGKVRAEATFAQHEVEDCWDRLDRGDVRSKVEQLIEKVTRPAAQSPPQRV